jgi:hypothetical protein
MTPNRWLLAVGILLVALPLAACGQQAVDAARDPAAVVEEIPGSELSRVTLTADAAERLGIETALVEEVAMAGGTSLAVPYAAVLYDSDGTTWAYVSHEELVFVREQLVIDHVAGDLAVLTEGPAPGTTVVTIGAAELYGAEIGLGGGH